MTVVHVHAKDAPLQDPLGVRRGVTGRRAEIREALILASFRHDCHDYFEPDEDDAPFVDDGSFMSGQIIDVGNVFVMTELLDRLVAIAERG